MVYSSQDIVHYQHVDFVVTFSGELVEHLKYLKEAKRPDQNHLQPPAYTYTQLLQYCLIDTQSF